MVNIHLDLPTSGWVLPVLPNCHLGPFSLCLENTFPQGLYSVSTGNEFSQFLSASTVYFAFISFVGHFKHTKVEKIM